MRVSVVMMIPLHPKAITCPFYLLDFYLVDMAIGRTCNLERSGIEREKIEHPLQTYSHGYIMDKKKKNPKCGSYCAIPYILLPLPSFSYIITRNFQTLPYHKTPYAVQALDNCAFDPQLDMTAFCWSAFLQQ